MLRATRRLADEARWLMIGIARGAAKDGLAAMLRDRAWDRRPLQVVRSVAVVDLIAIARSVQIARAGWIAIAFLTVHMGIAVLLLIGRPVHGRHEILQVVATSSLGTWASAERIGRTGQRHRRAFDLVPEVVLPRAESHGRQILRLTRCPQGNRLHAECAEHHNAELLGNRYLEIVDLAADWADRHLKTGGHVRAVEVGWRQIIGQQCTEAVLDDLLRGARDR